MLPSILVFVVAADVAVVAVGPVRGVGQHVRQPGTAKRLLKKQDQCLCDIFLWPGP